MPPVINEEKCISYGTCAQICPLDVLKYDKTARKVTVRYPDECCHSRLFPLAQVDVAARLWLAMPILTPYFLFVRPNAAKLHDISDSIRVGYQAMGKLSERDQSTGYRYLNSIELYV